MSVSVDLTLAGVALSSAVPEALVVKPTRPLVGRRRDVFIDIPGKAGAWTFPEQPGDRTLEFDIDIQAASFEERRAAVVALADWCDLGARAALIVSDEPDRYHEVILDNDPNPDEWLVAGTITLEFRAGPYSLSTVISSETLAVAGAGSDTDTFTIPDTIWAEPVIEVTPTNGTITGFTITINGVALSYTGPTITSGNTVTINTISDTVTSGASGDTMLTGAYNPGALLMGLVSGEFPILDPGENTWALTWDGTATTVTVEITWRRRYR